MFFNKFYDFLIFVVIRKEQMMEFQFVAKELLADLNALFMLAGLQNDRLLKLEWFKEKCGCE